MARPARRPWARWGPPLLLVVLALGLRLWGLDYGLPAIAHDDEWRYVRGAVGMLQTGQPLLDLGGHPWTYVNPTGFTLLNTPFVAVADLGAGGQGDVMARFLATPGRYHLAGRLASSLAGVGAVLVTYLAGVRLLGLRYGWLAGALLAVCPLHVRESHFATNDACLSLWAGAVLLGSLRFLERPDRRRAFALGVAIGAAVATKYTGVFLLAPVVWVVWRSPSPNRSNRVVVAGLGACAAGLLLFPAVLVEPGLVWTSIKAQSAIAAQGWAGQRALPPALQLGECLLRALGPLALGAALAGLWLQLRQRAWHLLAFPLVHVAVVAASALFTIRYQAPLLPYLCVAAAWGGRRLLTSASGGPRAAVLALALLPPAWSSVRIAHVLAGVDTRQVIPEWVRPRLRHDGVVTVATQLDGGRFLPTTAAGQLDPRIQVALLSEPAPSLAQLRAAGVEVVILTQTVELAPSLRALDVALGREATLAAEALPGPDDLPFDLDEALGPWARLGDRVRPGPWVRVYTLGEASKN